jgi:hypothetical protein
MNDYKAMYAEYCLKAGDRSRLGPGTTAWMMKSRVEKYFENNKDSS